MKVLQSLRRNAISLILVFETILCLLIINIVRYTPIDYPTYIQQVRIFEQGERNYYEIKGDTGPLVYPAGFLYTYSFISWITSFTLSVGAVQMVFALVYLCTVYLAMRNGHLGKVPEWLLCMVALSRRAHSIFILRLFNDGPSALLSQLSVYFFMRKNWVVGCIFLSLSVSIKMNALLYAPGVAFILFTYLPIEKALCLIIFVCGGIQLAIGFPFILHNPIAYFHKAFELTRVFEHKWSANFQFLPEEVFRSKSVSVVLLLSTILVYLLFFNKVWKRNKDNLLLILYSSNFIGIAFSRTIHFQFYVWYSFTLPALVHFASWSKKDHLNWLLRIGTLLGIEFVYNYPGVGDNPSTPFSSFSWQLLHVFLLVGLFLGNSRKHPKASLE
jgi:alpha-1,3-mannosyltransferase